MKPVLAAHPSTTPLHVAPTAYQQTLSEIPTPKLERILTRLILMPVRKSGTTERIATALTEELAARKLRRAA